jgi:hypothetical protein
MKGLKNEKIGLWLFKLTLYQELTMWETLVSKDSGIMFG